VPLTITQQSDIRRHLGLAVGGLWRTSPAAGTLAVGAAGYRWNQAYGLNEWRMNNLMPDEECRLTGNYMGGVALMGPLAPPGGTPNPQTGDTVTMTFTGAFAGSPHSVIATALEGDSLIALTARMSQAVNVDSVMLAAGFYSLAPYGTGPFAQNYVQGNPLGNLGLPIPQLAIINPNIPFTISVATSGLEGPAVTNQGVQLPPYAPVDWTKIPTGTLYGFLPILNALEGAWAGATQNQDISRADDFFARMDERQDRRALYREWCVQLRDFLFGIAGTDGGIIGGGNYVMSGRVRV
jgi:hypothetical protein